MTPGTGRPLCSIGMPPIVYLYDAARSGGKDVAVYRPKKYPLQRHYLPELTYGRPGLRIVLARLLRGGSAIHETKIGALVCIEVPCTLEHWLTALWCCGIDPAVVTTEPSSARPVADPYRPYIRLDWRDSSGERSRIVRIADGAVMWAGYTTHVTRAGSSAPCRGPRLPEHTTWQPGESVCHPDWAALSWEARGAILESLKFLEIPPPAMSLDDELAHGRDRREALAILLNG